MALSRRNVLLTGSDVAAAALALSGTAPAQATDPQNAASGTAEPPDNEKTLRIVTLRDLEAEADG